MKLEHNDLIFQSMLEPKGVKIIHRPTWMYGACADLQLSESEQSDAAIEILKAGLLPVLPSNSAQHEP
jgi:hypothetical protein